MNEIKVVITSGYRWPYFEWFLLGMYELADEKKITLEFKLPLFSKLLSLVSNDKKNLIRLIDKLHRSWEKETYNLNGYIEQNGCRKYFVIDSADSPFLYESKSLESCDIYFKEQCPIDINTNGFSLTPEITIPWLDHEHVERKIKNLTDVGKRRFCESFHKNRYKIKPLIVGPRSISGKSITYKSLKDGYERYLSGRKTDKHKKIMCYFGNALGPKIQRSTNDPDYDWEADIMSFYGEKISHPNEKRARFSEIIEHFPSSDSRIISKSNADGGIIEDVNKIIPLKDFCAHISKFEYNANVSGYRLSIPTRFIESFIVGTAIITDKLHVKWYLPFEGEVVETSEMGYLPIDKVNWEKVKEDIENLPKTNPQKIVDDYEKKWSPKAVATYIVNTVLES